MTHQGRPTAHQTTRRARTLGLFRRGRKAEAAAEVDTPTHDTGDPADVGGDPTGDADADADSVDDIGGADAAKFTINATTGVITVATFTDDNPAGIAGRRRRGVQ